jgi:hypothetical protein
MSATVLPATASRSTAHLPRPTLHAPRLTLVGPVGSGRAQALPPWLPPFTNNRIGKDRTGPDLDDRPLSIQYVTEPSDS